MKHLQIDLIALTRTNDKRHAQEVMKDLGIIYLYAVPQSLYDSWWFFNCSNIPDKLPDFVEELKVNPKDCVGYGLSQEMADNILRA